MPQGNRVASWAKRPHVMELEAATGHVEQLNRGGSGSRKREPDIEARSRGRVRVHGLQCEGECVLVRYAHEETTELSVDPDVLGVRVDVAIPRVFPCCDHTALTISGDRGRGLVTCGQSQGTTIGWPLRIDVATGEHALRIDVVVRGEQGAVTTVGPRHDRAA